MESYARRLFGIAASLNFLFAFALLFLRPVLAPLMGLDPVAGTNRVFAYLAAFLVGAFGYAYLRVAADPRRFRPFVELGAIGKLLAVTAATIPWLAGEIGWRLPVVIGGDLRLRAALHRLPATHATGLTPRDRPHVRPRLLPCRRGGSRGRSGPHHRRRPARELDAHGHRDGARPRLHVRAESGARSPARARCSAPQRRAGSSGSPKRVSRRRRGDAGFVEEDRWASTRIGSFHG